MHRRPFASINLYIMVPPGAVFTAYATHGPFTVPDTCDIRHVHTESLLTLYMHTLVCWSALSPKTRGARCFWGYDFLSRGQTFPISPGKRSFERVGGWSEEEILLCCSAA